MGWDEAKDPKALDIPLSEALPSQTEGNQKILFTQDQEAINLLNSVLKQLKLMNMQLAIMTDCSLKPMDVEV